LKSRNDIDGALLATLDVKMDFTTAQQAQVKDAGGFGFGIGLDNRDLKKLLLILTAVCNHTR